VTEGERDPERSGPGRWRGLAGFAVLLTVASILPVSSIVSATGGAGGGEHWPISVPLGHTDPFHLVGYAALAGLVARVTGETRRGLLLAVAATVAFGFAIELVQRRSRGGRSRGGTWRSTPSARSPVRWR